MLLNDPDRLIKGIKRCIADLRSLETSNADAMAETLAAELEAAINVTGDYLAGLRRLLQRASYEAEIYRAYES